MLYPRRLALFLLLAMFFAAAPPAHAQQSPQPTPPTTTTQSAKPQALTDCSTNSSPFGGVLTLGREQEALVSYAGGFNTNQQRWLLNARYDVNNAKQLFLQDSWPPVGQTPAAQLQNVNEPVGTAVDLDGDSKDEFVQAFTDSAGTIQLNTTLATGTKTTNTSIRNRRQLAIATGNITRLPEEARRVAIASIVDPAFFGANPQLVSYVGAVSVMVPLAGGDGTFNDSSMGLPPRWSSVENNRAFPRATSLAVGDLDGDGFKDEMVLAVAEGGLTPSNWLQIIVLKYDPKASAATTTLLSDRIKEIASTRIEVANPISSVKVAVGDTDAIHLRGDPTNFADEIVVATDSYPLDKGSPSSIIELRKFSMQTNTDDKGNLLSRSIVQTSTPAVINAQHTDMQLALGDTDGSGWAKPVLAYRAYGNNSPLVIQTFDTFTSTFTPHNSISTFDNFRAGVGSLSLAVGDMNRDGIAEIVAAFRDSGNQLQVVQAADQAKPIGDGGIQVLSFTRDGTNGRNGAFAITTALGDWNDDSLKAVYAPAYGGNIRCATVEEPNLTAVMFPPPYWERLQGDRVRGASIGESTSTGSGTESNLELSMSHSASAYLGVQVGGEVAGIGAEASLKATVGYEYRATQSSGNGIDTSVKTSQEFSSLEGPFVVVQRATHDCYTYQFRQSGEQLDGAARFCEARGFKTVFPNLESWDTDYGPVNNPDSQQWAPIGRDWASLSLFRNVTQSSTAGNYTADLAVDGNTGDLSAAHDMYQQTGARLAQNTVSSTNVEPQPWWQVDLGLTQPLTAVRVWNRYNYDCGQQTCAAQMGSFYVFVSDTDMGTISNDPNVLKNDSRVRAYFFNQAGEKVSNVQTMDNIGGKPTAIRGRYVRVQLTGTAALQLSEVQVFNNEHVDPDRYPVWVRDPVDNPYTTIGGKTKYTFSSKGYFEVGVHAPDGTVKPVRMRGNLLWTSSLWNSSKQPVITKNPVVISKGDAEFGWSMEKERNDFLTQSQSIEHNAKIGAEFEAQMGAGVKVQVGSSYEFSTGILTDTTNRVSWGQSLEIGGEIQGFPETLDGKIISLGDVRNCEYSFQPFYYEADEQATSGFSHRFMMVDSIVPDSTLDRSTDLSFCQASVSDTPLFESSTTAGAPGSSFILTAAGFAANSRATLSIKGPNDAAYRTLAQLSMKDSGQLVFVLATKPTDSLGDYSIQLAVDGANTRATTAAAQTLTTNISLRPSAPLLTTTPSGATVVTTIGQVIGGQRIFVPLTVR